MKRCPICDGLLRKGMATCPDCGKPLSIPPDAYLKKDRWSFTDLEKDESQFAKTVMADVPSKNTPSSVAEIPVDKTLAMGSATQRKVSTPPSQKPSGPGREKTIQGIEVLNRTMPLELENETSTKIRVSQGNVPNLTVPLTLEKESKEESSGVKDVSPQASRDAANTIPLEPPLMVASSSVKERATEPLEIATPYKRPDPRTERKPAPRVDRGQVRAGVESRPPERRRTVSALVASFLLIGVWFVPSVIASPLVFPYQTIRSVAGPDLLSLVAAPLAGAAALVILLIPILRRVRAFLVMSLGFSALAVPLVLGTPAVPLPGYIVLIVSIAATFASVIIQMQTRKDILGHITVALIPATFMGVAVYGVLTAQLPLQNLTVFKDPMTIYAGMLMIAVSAEELFSR